MRTSRMLLVPVMVGLLALAGCGGDDDAAAPDQARDTDPPAQDGDAEPEVEPVPEPEPDTDPAAPAAANPAAAKRPAGEAGLRVAAPRAQLVSRRSEFGTVLFDANGQVVYAFERDERNRSNCTSADCVKAWPPMLTTQAPTAGAGVDAAKLGTITRDDGSLQVTYAGRPLYFYEHEAPGEITCHNVNLHGGLWWVVTPAGENAPA